LDLHLTGATATAEEKAAVDTILGAPDSGWTGGERAIEADGRVAYGGAHKAKDQRTLLLASVSHDLRTPLTRLKLEVALAEPSPRLKAIKRDLAEMEHMIDEYLAFARGEDGEALEIVASRRFMVDIHLLDKPGR